MSLTFQLAMAAAAVMAVGYGILRVVASGLARRLGKPGED